MATESKTKKAPAEKKAPAPKAAAAAPAANADTRTSAERRREITGVVVSNKMQKTIVVTVDRSVRHGMYGKYVTKSRRFKAHDEKNDAKIGDLVLLVESRPLSRDKRWALNRVIRRGNQAADINV